MFILNNLKPFRMSTHQKVEGYQLILHNFGAM